MAAEADLVLVCHYAECTGRVFRRPCELKIHLNKHIKPYKCDHTACKDHPGFTYSGGLLRHAREVHKQGHHLRSFHCPHSGCIRSEAKSQYGFTREENLAEHLRRRHPDTDEHQLERIRSEGGPAEYAYNQPNSLRKRILEEARESSQKQYRRPQSRWFKAPSFAGTAAFDLRAGLAQVPYSKRKFSAPPTRPRSNHNVQESEVIPGAASWGSDEHHSRMMAELDDLERSSSASPPNQDIEPIQPDSGPSFRDNTSSMSSFPATDRQSNPTQPDTRPISEAQLIAEVRGIYAGLVMAEKKCIDVVARQASSSKQFENHQWKTLVALHRTLLQEHHDFFLAGQHPSASEPLRNLAMKYAMPARMWQSSIRDTLNLLQHRLPTCQTSLASFTHLIYTSMSQLEKDLPQLSHEWDLIRYNLHEYFTALRSDGIDIPMSFINCWEQQYSQADRLIKRLVPPMDGYFFGDDEHVEWYFHAHLHPELNVTGNDGHAEIPTAVGLTEIAQYLMAGWLQWGRRIATSFHSFVQVFIFLGLVGTAAYVLDPE